MVVVNCTDVILSGWIVDVDVVFPCVLHALVLFELLTNWAQDI